jgi:hypothetical protein
MLRRVVAEKREKCKGKGEGFLSQLPTNDLVHLLQQQQERADGAFMSHAPRWRS